jgi:hypothetical protein
MTRSVGGRAPPGIKRGPGGGLVENDIGNGNTQLNSLPRPVLQSRPASDARRLRRQRYAARIWSLGDRFAGLDPAVLRALGGDRLPAPPIHRVGGVG